MKNKNLTHDTITTIMKHNPEGAMKLCAQFGLSPNPSDRMDVYRSINKIIMDHGENGVKEMMKYHPNVPIWQTLGMSMPGDYLGPLPSNTLPMSERDHFLTAVQSGRYYNFGMSESKTNAGIAILLLLVLIFIISR